jgi:hypothetical protein
VAQPAALAALPAGVDEPLAAGADDVPPSLPDEDDPSFAGEDPSVLDDEPSFDEDFSAEAAAFARLSVR